MPRDQVKVLNNILAGYDRDIEFNRVTVTDALSMMLFEVTKVGEKGEELVRIRDYAQIAEKGAFRYAGQADTMLKEGLMPEDVYDGLKTVMPEDTRHVGPSYLRVKGLLTHRPTRNFFGKQMAYQLSRYFSLEPPPKKEGVIVCIPNMTGGAWIGDETARELEKMVDGYEVWTSTPYAREMRKVVDVKAGEKKLTEFVEGLLPTPAETAAVVCFEELRTAAETTQNATNMYRRFGYNEENNVKIVEASVFDYRHPVGVERLKRLGVAGIYLVDGRGFFDSSALLGNITVSQQGAGNDWLAEPWNFTRKILPDLQKLAGK